MSNNERSLTYTERQLREFGEQLGAFLAVRETSPALLRYAREEQRAYRASVGYRASNAPLLTAPGSQTKLGKSETPTYGLMLVPERGIGKHNGRQLNLCPAASLGCAAACLNTSGKGRLSSVQVARQHRLKFILDHPSAAACILASEILAALAKHGGRILLRLNVVSDIRWELVAPNALLRLHAMGVGLYDYSAWQPEHRAPMPFYHLTYSRKEHHSAEYVSRVVARGDNVAVVFDTKRGEPLPDYWQGHPVIDGDKSDDRTLDPTGVIVGLRAKGEAIGTRDGFVVHVDYQDDTFGEPDPDTMAPVMGRAVEWSLGL